MYSKFTMQIPSRQSQSRADSKKNFCEHTKKCMRTTHSADLSHTFTKLTMKHRKMLRNLSLSNKQNISTRHQICKGIIQQSGPYRRTNPVPNQYLQILPPTFPIGYWCRLIPKINLCVNIIRLCRQNPLLYDWAVLEGEFYFDAIPLAPLGT